MYININYKGLLISIIIIILYLLSTIYYIILFNGILHRDIISYDLTVLCITYYNIVLTKIQSNNAQLRSI
jgi:hypothetical protein